MTTALERAGYDVTTFQQAGDCLTQLRQEPMACHTLIAAVRLLDRDGISLLAQIKGLLPCLPVILITAYADVAMVVKAFKLGVSDFIEKPFGARTLLAAVESACGNGERPHTHAR